MPSPVASNARILIGLAELAPAFDERSNEPGVETRAIALLGALLPGYHVRMANDARRNRAWDQALRRAIRPGMRVLDGPDAGRGILAEYVGNRLSIRRNQKC